MVSAVPPLVVLVDELADADTIAGAVVSKNVQPRRHRVSHLSGPVRKGLERKQSLFDSMM